MIEPSDFADFALLLADHMAIAITDSINYHLDMARGRYGLHALYSTLMAARVDHTNFPTEAALSADELGWVGAVAMANEAATFTDTRKITIPLLYVISLRKITIHMIPDPMNPRFLRIYRAPKSSLEEGEFLPPNLSPIPKAPLTALT
jgi:hypothetical protein